MRFDRFALIGRGAHLGLALAAALSLWTAQAHATARTWPNAVSGSASTASNWSPSGAPTSADDVTPTANGVYTISWASPQDTLSYLHCTGTPNMSITGVLGVRNTVSAVLGELIVGFGTLRANQVIIGSQVGAHLRISGGITGSGQVVHRSPNAPAIFADTTSTIARLYITGGGQFLSNSWIESARKNFASCSLYVDGYRNFFGSTYRSTLGTLTNSGGGNRGDLILTPAGGLAAHTYLDVRNGGLLDVKGSLYAGSGGWGIVRLYETTPGTNPKMSVLGNTRVGVDPTSGHSGTGDLIIEGGTALLGGNLEIGDPDHTLGTPGFGYVYIEGGTTIVGGAIQMPTALSGSLVHTGGTLKVLSGNSEIRQDIPLNVSSGVGGSPTLIVNGSADFMPYPGTSTPVALGVGRGGVGRVRVCGYGARLDSQGMIAIADSVGGSGIFEVDSSAIVSSVDTVRVGDGGQFSIQRDAIVSVQNVPVPKPFESSGAVVMDHGWLIAPTGTFRSPGSFTGNGILFGAFENQSGLSIPSDTLEVSGSLDNRGTISGSGTLRVDSGWFQSSGTVAADLRITNATLIPHEPPQPVAAPPAALGIPAAGPASASHAGSGVLGVIDPPLGHLVVDGDLTITLSEATTAVRIGSQASGLRDTIEVTGQAALTGTLALTSIVGDEPVAGDTITVLEAGGVTGTFTAVTLDGQDASGDVDLLYDPNAVRVVIGGGTTAVGDDPASHASPSDVRFSAARIHGATAFVLELPAAAHVRLVLYDVAGREVARLADDAFAMGRHQFRAPGVASGLYFARAQVDLGDRRIVRTTRAPLLR